MNFQNESHHKTNKKIAIIESAENNLIFSTNIKEAINDKNKKLFINTDNNIFKGKTFAKGKTTVKIYNLKNYKKIINKNNRFNSSSYEKQYEDNIISSFFDSLKLRTIKKEFIKNNPNLFINNKGIITENKISHKNFNNFNNINYFNNTDLNRIKRIEISDLSKRKNFSIPKKELSYNSDIYINKKTKSLKDFSNSLDNKKLNQKIKKNKTIVLPDIKEIKNNFKSLIFKVEKLDYDLKNQKPIINLNDIQDEKKSNNNSKIKCIKDNKKADKIFDEEKNQNILKNKNNLNKYIKKFDNFTYKNKIINSFFKEKQKQKQNENFFRSKDENEEEILRKSKKEALIQIKIMDQIKELKNKVKSNIDKDIFKMFNKNT